MKYWFVPQNLNPNARSCAINVFCDSSLTSVKYCHETAYPDGLVQLNGRLRIDITQNGTYYVELTTEEEQLITQFSVCHLKSGLCFAGGDGTSVSPYLISNCAQFNNIRSNMYAHYRLISDLDFSQEMKNLCWIPIGHYTVKEPKVDFNLPSEEQNLGCMINYGFSGELDGNGYTISGLMCYGNKKNELGLFGACGNNAYIHHLKVVFPIFQSNAAWSVGIIAGRATNAKIEWCFVEQADILATLVAGGIVGLGDPGLVVRSCQFTGRIQSQRSASNFGGIIGNAVSNDEQPTFIEDCYVNADISGAYCAGGITTGTASILRCCFRGVVSGSVFVGGITSDGTLGLVDRCICIDSEIHYTSNTVISNIESFWVTFSDHNGQEVGAKYIEDGWKNHAGRILCDDYLLNSNVGEQRYFNYATESCKLYGADLECSNLAGTLRDGITVSDEDVRNPNFYRSIGWDFDLVWENGKDRLPKLQDQSKISE